MKAIGLTGGAFYNHFPSKDELFTEVVRQELSNSPWRAWLTRAPAANAWAAAYSST